MSALSILICRGFTTTQLKANLTFGDCCIRKENVNYLQHDWINGLN